MHTLKPLSILPSEIPLLKYQAIKHYTEGVGIDAKHHVCYSNRSACYAALGKWDEALSDANVIAALYPYPNPNPNPKARR